MTCRGNRIRTYRSVPPCPSQRILAGVVPVRECSDGDALPKRRVDRGTPPSLTAGFASRRQQPVDGGGARLQDSLANLRCQCEMAMSLHRRQECRNGWSQALAAGLLLQRPNRVLAVKASDLRKLVEDFLFVGPARAPIALRDGPNQFSSGCQTQLPPCSVARHLQKSTGNIFMRQPPRAGNKTDESTRPLQ